MGIAEAIERNSLHPVAQAIIKLARKEKVQGLLLLHVEEKPGSQISGIVGWKEIYYLRGKENYTDDVHLLEGSKLVAEFVFV